METVHVCMVLGIPGGRWSVGRSVGPATYVVTQAWPIHPRTHSIPQFFGRRRFRGAVVEVNQLNLGEWLVFLGGASKRLVASVVGRGMEGCNHG